MTDNVLYYGDNLDAEIGVLISMEEPTQPMRAEAADAGFYSSPGWNSKHRGSSS